MNLFLSDIAEFEGKKGRSGRKKSRNHTVNTSGGRVIRPSATVTYKSELSPVQKISTLAVAYKNIVSPTANLIDAGAGVRRLMHNLELAKLANRKPTTLQKLGRVYDGTVTRAGNTARTGGAIRSLFPTKKENKRSFLKVGEEISTVYGKGFSQTSKKPSYKEY